MTQNEHNEPINPTEEDPAYVAWLEEQDARGELAGAPDTMLCHECGGFDGVEKRVIKKGKIVNSADPTQTYVLDCGHVVI